MGRALLDLNMYMAGLFQPRHQPDESSRSLAQHRERRGRPPPKARPLPKPDCCMSLPAQSRRLLLDCAGLSWMEQSMWRLSERLTVCDFVLSVGKSVDMTDNTTASAKPRCPVPGTSGDMDSKPMIVQSILCPLRAVGLDNSPKVTSTYLPGYAK